MTFHDTENGYCVLRVKSPWTSPLPF
ncbi:hypothetical protein [Glacieibacterium megasporae]